MIYFKQGRHLAFTGTGIEKESFCFYTVAEDDKNIWLNECRLYMIEIPN
jgi:hypothetical protein